MMNEVMKLFEKRRNNLINLLENNSDELDAARQHQIYGAIMEIETMLKTLEHYREYSIKENLKKRNDLVLDIK